MTPLKIALLLFICYEGCALTSAFDIYDLENVPEDMRENGDVCKDCTQIFELVADLLSNADLQKKMLQDLDSLCAHLPGQVGKMCKDEVDKFLPIAISLVTSVVKPAEVCKIIGLCGSENQKTLLQYFAQEAVQDAMTGQNAKPSTQCSICILILKTLEDLLPKSRTEEAVVHLLGEICHVLPRPYQDECRTVTSKFGKTVVDAILGFATPQAICALIHLCKGEEATQVDPCTWPAYRCKDMTTAIRCSTLFYCKRFVWKTVNYSTV